ncbi:MAG: ATP-binding protein [Lachnospiraceae bacterium]
MAGLCRELGVPLYVERGRRPEPSPGGRLGRGEAGRRLRYDFLERTADAIGASRRRRPPPVGSGGDGGAEPLRVAPAPEGLAGIPRMRGRLIRPLLQTPRQEIEAYLTAHGLGHVEDETNDSMDFTPQPPATGGVASAGDAPPCPRAEHRARNAAILRRENVFLDRLARSYLETAVSDCQSRRKSGRAQRLSAMQPTLYRILRHFGTLPERTVAPTGPWRTENRRYFA